MFSAEVFLSASYLIRFVQGELRGLFEAIMTEIQLFTHLNPLRSELTQEEQLFVYRQAIKNKCAREGNFLKSY